MVQITAYPTLPKYEFAEGLNLVSFSQSQLFVRVSHVVTWFVVRTIAYEQLILKSIPNVSVIVEI